MTTGRECESLVQLQGLVNFELVSKFLLIFALELVRR